MSEDSSKIPRWERQFFEENLREIRERRNIAKVRRLMRGVATFPWEQRKELGVTPDALAELFAECVRSAIIKVHRGRAGIDELLELADDAAAWRIANRLRSFRPLVAKIGTNTLHVIRMEWDEDLFRKMMNLVGQMDPRLQAEELGSTDEELNEFSARLRA